MFTTVYWEQQTESQLLKIRARRGQEVLIREGFVDVFMDLHISLRNIRCTFLNGINVVMQIRGIFIAMVCNRKLTLFLCMSLNELMRIILNSDILLNYQYIINYIKHTQFSKVTA
ncbi:Hypothetical_protein [Hexamita inflata]|uniref:Hypothetical_protein n=1 Tax=Hexamita inflata TaxID=28002 RepID=A0ABP1HC07_9EUKA